MTLGLRLSQSQEKDAHPWEGSHAPQHVVVSHSPGLGKGSQDCFHRPLILAVRKASGLDARNPEKAMQWGGCGPPLAEGSRVDEANLA